MEESSQAKEPRALHIFPVRETTDAGCIVTIGLVAFPPNPIGVLGASVELWIGEGRIVAIGLAAFPANPSRFMGGWVELWVGGNSTGSPNPAAPRTDPEASVCRAKA